MQRYLSLSQELHLLADLMQGAMLLADLVRHDQAAQRRDEKAAAGAIAAMARLVSQRLHMLERTILGELDPSWLLAPHNEVRSAAPDDGEDVRLAWSAARRLSWAQEQLAAAELAMSQGMQGSK